MNIILGEDTVRPLKERYTVLPLDSFQINGQDQPIQSYCVIETVPLTEIKQTKQWQDLHENLMINYGRQNWHYCEQAIGHLQGKWNRELDSFYQDLLARVQARRDHGVDPTWSPVIQR